MRTDRELLELAAKAVGLRLEWDGHPDAWQPMYYEGKTYHAWNPLTDDGDALRLAVKLRLVVDMSMEDEAHVQYPAPSTRFPRSRAYHPLVEDGAEDVRAATRRAIVRAAAQLGAQPHPDHKDGGAA